MSTKYLYSISMLVPEVHWQIAGKLIAAISEQIADLGQFGSAKFQPSYDAANIQAKASHVLTLQLAKYGADAAPGSNPAQVQAILAKLESIFQENPDIENLVKDAQIVTSQETELVPNVLVIGINIDVSTMVSMFGLQRIENA